MASRTPVEIWSNILTDAIYVPLFFEEDPAETYRILSLRRYYHELPYWESERTRNLLRRVCKGWNSYLQQFNHRYVRLTDVYHNRIPVDVISLAIRLDIQFQSNCACSKCSFRWIGDGTVESPSDAMMKLLTEATAGSEYGTSAKQWSTKIINGSLSRDGREFRLIMHMAPNLRTTLGWRCWDLAPLSNLPSGLRCFITDTCHSLHEVTSQITARLSSLTTLYVLVETPLRPITSLELPCLRHLIIHIHNESNYEPLELIDVVESLLKKVGSNLHSFIIQRWKEVHPTLWFVIPERIWALAPKVTCIGLPGIWETGPPLGHPLNTVITSPDWSYEGIQALSDDSPFFQLFPPVGVGEWAAVRRLHVMMTNTWSYILVEGGFIQKDLVIRLSNAYQRAGIKFTDSEGISLVQHIVFLITFHWKGKIRRNRFPYRHTNLALMFWSAEI